MIFWHQLRLQVEVLDRVALHVKRVDRMRLFESEIVILLKQVVFLHDVAVYIVQLRRPVVSLVEGSREKDLVQVVEPGHSEQLIVRAASEIGAVVRMSWSRILLRCGAHSFARAQNFTLSALSSLLVELSLLFVGVGLDLKRIPFPPYEVPHKIHLLHIVGPRVVVVTRGVSFGRGRLQLAPRLIRGALLLFLYLQLGCIIVLAFARVLILPMARGHVVVVALLFALFSLLVLTYARFSPLPKLAPRLLQALEAEFGELAEAEIATLRDEAQELEVGKVRRGRDVIISVVIEINHDQLRILVAQPRHELQHRLLAASFGPRLLSRLEYLRNMQVFQVADYYQQRLDVLFHEV